MREYLPLAGLLANVLALPKTIDDQAQSDNAFRAMVQSGMPGLQPAQLDQIAPPGESFAGSDVPVLGTALRGVGTVGQVLQGVLGAPPSAPRPSLQTYLQLQAVGQGAAKARANEDFAATLTDPRARAAARAGSPGTAAQFERGEGNETAIIGRVQRLQATDPNNPELPILRAQLDDIQQRKLAYAREAAGVKVDAATATRQNRRSEGADFLRGFGFRPMLAPNVGEFRPMIEESAARHGVPLDYALALVTAESNGDPNAVSDKGAIGLTQLMPATARDYNVDPRIPAQNIEGGMRHFRRLLDKYGDPRLAFAAYNAGEGNVDDHGGVPPFPETQKYLQRIFGGSPATAQPQPVAQIPQGPPTQGPQPNSTVITGGSMSSDGAASVQFGRPDPADTDIQLLARSANIDLRQASPEQAQFLLKAKQGLEAARKAAERDTAQVPDQDRQAIVGMRTMQYLLNRALTEFSPEERDRFVGYFANPARSAAQFVSPDPRFAEWNAIVAQLQAGKFDLAGKALTETENRITQDFIPTSRELGGVTEFDAKAREYLKSSQFRIDQRLQALGGVGQVREAVAEQPVAGTTTLPTTPSGRKYRVVQ